MSERSQSRARDKAAFLPEGVQSSTKAKLINYMISFVSSNIVEQIRCAMLISRQQYLIHALSHFFIEMHIFYQSVEFS